MQVNSLSIPDVKVFTPTGFGDARGVFTETYSRAKMAPHGCDMEFVQDNQTLSRSAGVLRGLHFQAPPFAQDKLVRVLTGRIFDVVVDIRHGSPSFGRWVSEELSASNSKMMFVPKGFAHGFLTLEPETTVFYKVSNVYAPETEGGVMWNDPDLGITWPLQKIGGLEALTLSEKDRQYGPLKDEPVRFTHDKPPLTS